jgi:ribonuclease D
VISSGRVQHDHITTDDALRQFCRDLAGAPSIAFDTEFVSEHTYRPQLCLVQVATRDRLAVIDPLALQDMKPFWELLAASGHETIVHAGREELLFCLQSTGKRPANLLDVQIAAGLVGYDYPAGYGSLMFKLLGERAQKGETRTDWRMRPLSNRQIEYALDDVRYLHAMRDKLRAKLEELNRPHWLDTEMAAWQDDVEASRSRERWWRVSGVSGLSARSLAIVRELWRWRESEAERRDCPTKRVLRDDLIVELAKRKTSDPQQIRALRGLERGDLQRALPRLGEAIGRALALGEDELPRHSQREMPPQLNVLGQFLSSALSSICRSAEVAASIVGTASDVRDLIAYRLDMGGAGEDGPPILGQGWRAEVVGKLIEDLLQGKVSIRIRDPLDDSPLAFEPIRS